MERRLINVKYRLMLMKYHLIKGSFLIDMKKNSAIFFVILFFGSVIFVSAQKCETNSVSTEEVIKNGKSEFIYQNVSKLKELKIKFPLPYKIRAIMEIYPVLETELQFKLILPIDRTKLIKKIASDESFVFCLKDLPQGNYLLRIGDARGIRSVTYKRIEITEAGSKKMLVIR
jgi:hypothetical protein